MSKNCEKTLKTLSNDFHDQRPKRMCFQTVCSQKSCQNAFNRSKLANKRPKWSNGTKLEMRLKTSKTAKKCGKPPRSDFRDQTRNQNLFLKKTNFWLKSCKTALNHLKFAQKQQIRPNSAKTKNQSKTSKTAKS